MADLYNMTRDVWSLGLHSGAASDAARVLARALAAQGDDVVLWDEGEVLRFSPEHDGAAIPDVDLLDLSLVSIL